MSEANVETVRRFADAYLRGDMEEAMAQLDPEVVYKPVEAAEMVGRDAARSSWRRWAEDWEDLEAVPEDFIDAGDRVLVPVVFRGRGTGSGIEVEGRYYQVLTVRDGQVVRWEEFSERAEALTAAGLPE